MSDHPLAVIPPEPSRSLATEHDLIQKAYQMVQAGKRGEALNLVTKALMTNPNNPNSLYLYAQLTPDQPSAVQALKQVLYANPNHSEARLLLDRLQAAPPAQYTRPAQPVQPPPRYIQQAPPQYAQPVPPPPRVQPPGPDSNQLMQQMMMQHHMLMQQQMLNQQQLVQQQMLNQQQYAQQNMRNSGPVGMAVRTENDTAFWVGFFLAFLGLYGVAHMMNGKPASGLVYMVMGFIWDVIAVILTITIVGAVIAIPLHFVLAYSNAKDGAKELSVVSYW